MLPPADTCRTMYVPEMVARREEEVELSEGVEVGVADMVGVGELENCITCQSMEVACQLLPARGTTSTLLVPIWGTASPMEFVR